MGEKSDDALLRFISQRKAPKANSLQLVQDDTLKMPIAPTRFNNDFQTFPVLENGGGRRSTAEMGRNFQRSDDALRIQRDVFDTDVDDVDDTSVASPVATSPKWEQGVEANVTLPGFARMQDKIHASVEGIAGPHSASRSLSSHRQREGEANVLKSGSALVQMKHQKSLHHKPQSMSQAGFGNTTPRRQHMDGLDRPPRYFLDDSGFPPRSSNLAGNVAVNQDLQKTELKDMKSRRRRTPTPQATSPTPTTQQLAQRPEGDAWGGLVGKELFQHDPSVKLRTAPSNDSDLESQSSQEKEGPLKESDEARFSKRKRSLDYTREELAHMTYHSLKDESFDTDPRIDDQGLPAKLVNGTVSEKLQYAFSCRDIEQKATQRTVFFSSLTIEEHEECGDLIIEKFGAALARFKHLRQQKRALCKNFEHEIEQRFYLIEAKKDAIENEFKLMRTKGNDIVPRKPNGEADSGITN